MRPGPLGSVLATISECLLDEPLELVLLVGTPVVGGPGMPNREEVETQPGQANDEIRFITNVNGAYYTLRSPGAWCSVKSVGTYDGLRTRSM